MRQSPVLILVAALAASPAAAAQTAWQEVAPDVRLRVISSDVRAADGTTMVGLEIEMPPDTRTYWRVPGQTGLPAEFALAGSGGVTKLTPLWPYPGIDRTGGYLDYVYAGPTVLPIIATLEGDDPVMDVTVTLGICSNICMPAMANFSLPLSFSKADPAARLRLDQAVALTPIAWGGEPGTIGPVVFEGPSGSISVGVDALAIDATSIIADMGPAGPVFGTPQKSPDGKSVLLPLLGGGNGADLKGQPVNLTFLTPDGAYETTQVIGAAGT